ncbi:hypothetical protein L228DRAFT_243289 [Xylona heveae TC161]|uniref:DUF2293 domain-containing protein n=1 Tax=Xylona heveae (strain CBS 132557 / TC161) TaxID=1328760 RepID=A0A165JY51_XYLHT|nr:hypothetical protein L228DRAFT_243289 [Xylona heveae TC161]KZF26773.1 hypothetical protein L228DRAFT_243289 [Xylona heveae TC161]
MARVDKRVVSSRPARTKHSSHRTRPYKVVFESVTQAKKKLLTVISFKADAPPGFTFVPIGNPKLTQQCKEFSREEGRKVYIVSAAPQNKAHKNASNISHHIHRIGHHFASTVVAKACHELGLHLTPSGRAVRYSGQRTRPMQHLDALEDNNGPSLRSGLSQKKINAEARDAIRDLFPNIPKKDLHEIITRAFKKGTQKVGTAEELPLARRVQLAVVAHIRHVYTDYDRLLRTDTYQIARGKIEQACLDKLVQWRGDEGNGANELEEILREVIVISDDDSEGEEDDADIDELARMELTDRDASVEIISSQAFAEEMAMKPSSRPREPLTPEERPFAQAAEPVLLSVYRSAAPRPPDSEEKRRRRIERRGFYRYRAWDQAIDRYRNQPSHATIHGLGHQADAVERMPARISSSGQEPRTLYYERLEEPVLPRVHTRAMPALRQAVEPISYSGEPCVRAVDPARDAIHYVERPLVPARVSQAGHDFADHHRHRTFNEPCMSYPVHETSTYQTGSHGPFRAKEPLQSSSTVYGEPVDRRHGLRESIYEKAPTWEHPTSHGRSQPLRRVEYHTADAPICSIEYDRAGPAVAPIPNGGYLPRHKEVEPLRRAYVEDRVQVHPLPERAPRGAPNVRESVQLHPLPERARPRQEYYVEDRLPVQPPTEPVRQEPEIIYLGPSTEVSRTQYWVPKEPVSARLGPAGSSYEECRIPEPVLSDPYHFRRYVVYLLTGLTCNL